MGCTGSQAASVGSQAANSLKPPDVGVANIKGQLLSKMLSSDMAKSMSAKAMAAVLEKYPAAKVVFHVPETTNVDTTSETKEVQAAGDKLLNHYVDIAKTTDGNMDATIRKKAEELNKQGIKPEYIKAYGDSLAQNAVKDVGNKLSTEEENAWKTASGQITSKLTAEMAKLPQPASS